MVFAKKKRETAFNETSEYCIIKYSFFCKRIKL